MTDVNCATASSQVKQRPIELIRGADGKEVEVKTEADLHAVGKKYGVIKLLDAEPHWSDDGH